MHVFVVKSNDLYCVDSTSPGGVVLKWGGGSSPRKFLRKYVRNLAILDTFNVFIGLHIEVHSGGIN